MQVRHLHLWSNLIASQTALQQGVESLQIIGRGVMISFDEIRATIKELGIHIQAINENKLDGNIADELLGIDGFSIKSSDRNRNGGGVAIYMQTGSLRSIHSICLIWAPR